MGRPIDSNTFNESTLILSCLFNSSNNNLIKCGSRITLATRPYVCLGMSNVIYDFHVSGGGVRLRSDHVGDSCGGGLLGAWPTGSALVTPRDVPASGAI